MTSCFTRAAAVASLALASMPVTAKAQDIDTIAPGAGGGTAMVSLAKAKPDG